jgi:hypothetical protein
MRATLRLGVAVLLVAVLAGSWELIAMQSPGTPLYIGMLPGPIAALRELALSAALLLLGAASLMASLRLEPEPKLLIAQLHAGCVLALGSQLYAALQGMHGVQLFDLRADAVPLFAAKYSGIALFVVAYFTLARRLLASARA